MLAICEFKVLKMIRLYTLQNRNLAYQLPSGFTVKNTYRGLKKAWIGLKIAKQTGDQDKMKYYAEGIQKFEKQLNHPVSSFSDILTWEQISNASAKPQNNKSTKSKLADNL